MLLTCSHWCWTLHNVPWWVIWCSISSSRESLSHSRRVCPTLIVINTQATSSAIIATVFEILFVVRSIWCVVLIIIIFINRGTDEKCLQIGLSIWQKGSRHLNIFLRCARNFLALTFVNAKNLHISNISSTFAPHFWDGETQRNAKNFREVHQGEIWTARQPSRNGAKISRAAKTVKRQSRQNFERGATTQKMRAATKWF